ncbi:hypothetical protein BDB00DRAFT_821195 [Zychaea mexicana]|uniref:uncharacterized protein n=1 Tax=Zychaea mexicana TaxID=64656 RepID=UPI0022FE5DB9|nr:uncharacterized protein BDB00DRAFT_821195 [Zychaea mexicana]KAI9493905.1 hypothetical protein BDB00DRAFT_821195 [Zychaea mexicana]
MGLRDAFEMIHRAPSSPLGYFRANALNLMRFNHLEALDVCLQGIKNTPKVYPQVFQQCYEAAKTKHETAFALVALLPYETVTLIVGYLRFKDRLNLLGVSNTWRNKLIECPQIWNTLLFSPLKDSR